MFILALIAALAVKGGSITMYGGTAPKSLNAYLDNSHYTSVIFSLAYPTLLGTDEETGELEGQVAESWSVSSDGRQFTFRLDKNAKWSDLTPITAHDVKWTFDTVMDPANDTGPWKSVLSFFESPAVVDDRTVRPSEFLDKSVEELDEIVGRDRCRLARHIELFLLLDIAEAQVRGKDVLENRFCRRGFGRRVFLREGGR